MKDIYKLAQALINIRLGIRKTNKSKNTFKSK